jgi:TetR/AcrR family transcriptional regulator, transcriptional repressor for nem operon
VQKQTNRDKLLANGLRVVHQQGLAGASVRDIVEAAGVPQGSFSNHFASKEAFGVEILDLYFGFTKKVLAETLNNKDLKPLKPLEAYRRQPSVPRTTGRGKRVLIRNLRRRDNRA